LQIEQQEMQAEIERMEREKELEKAREAERQKKLDEAAAKQRAREKEIEEREVSIACCTYSLPNGVTVSVVPLRVSLWVNFCTKMYDHCVWSHRLHDLECAMLHWHLLSN